jgi:hypothetical protein
MRVLAERGTHNGGIAVQPFVTARSIEQITVEAKRGRAALFRSQLVRAETPEEAGTHK